MRFRSKTTALFLAPAFAVFWAGTLHASDNELIHCAAHFSARAQWLAKTNSEAATVAMFEHRASSLMQRLYEQAPPSDWEMVIGLEKHPYETQHENATLDIMTDFATQNGHTPPLCVEDQTCISCTELYKATS